MQTQKQVVEHIASDIQRLHSRFDELAVHWCIFNRRRKHAKGRPFVHWISGYDREAAAIFAQMRQILNDLAEHRRSEFELRATEDPGKFQMIIQNLRARLQHRTSFIAMLEVSMARFR